MTYNPITYTATGGQTVFNIPFTRISNDYVNVATKLVGATNYIAKGVGTDYTLVGNTIVFNIGLASGVKVRIWRKTNRVSLVDFTGVNNLTSSNLGLTTTQQSNIAEEVESDLDEVNALLDGFVTSIVGYDPDNTSNTYLELQGDVAAFAAQTADAVADLEDATAAFAAQAANVTTLMQNGTSPWNASRTYVVGNLVNYTGSLWLCLVGNTNSAPTAVNANWKKLATVDVILLMRDSIQGTTPIWASTTTLTMGTLNCLDSLRTSFITCSSVTLNFATTGLNGLDTGAIASNTWYYIYAILNPTTLATGYLASTSPTSPTLPSGFTKFRRLPLAVKTKTGSASLMNFSITNWGLYPTVRWVDASSPTNVSGWIGEGANNDNLRVLSAGASTTYASVSTASFVPAFSRYCRLAVSGSGTSANNCYVFIKDGDANTSATCEGAVTWFNNFNVGLSVIKDVSLTSGQLMYYKVSGPMTADLFVTSYTVTEVVG